MVQEYEVSSTELQNIPFSRISRIIDLVNDILQVKWN